MKTSVKVIPFQTLGLYIDKSIKATEGFCDFENLPHYDVVNDRLINPDVPFLSENVVSSPFNNKIFDLKSGVHLHFILPECLTKQLSSSQAYPPVPNRWLITKNGEQSWIVESDFLSKEPLPNQTQVTTIMPIAQYTDNPSIYEKDGKKYYQPFRYMGRCLTSEAYWSKNETSTENWFSLFQAPLNTMGYGHPMFSFFYPNCHSVFGFHDPNGLQTDIYTIEAWWEYDSQLVKETLFTELADTLKEESTATDLDTTDKVYKSSPFDFVLECITPVILNNDGLNQKDQYTIAIGNSPTEAASALLAAELAEAEPANMKKWLTSDINEDEALEYQIEDVLEAIQFDFLQQQQVDISAKFIEARHAKSFTTHNSGKVFDIAYEQRDPSTDDEDTTLEAYYDILKIEQIKTQLEEISTTIQQLNYFQKEYNKNVLLITSKEEQLFTSWYRYLVCAHPAEGFESTYPDPDKVFVQLMRDMCDVHILKKRTFDSYGETIDDTLTDLQKIKIQAHKERLDELTDEFKLTSGPYRIVPKSNANHALTVAGNSKKNGAFITQQKWAGTENQQWYLQKLDDGNYRIIAKHSGKAIDTEGAKKQKGARFIQWDYHSGDNQRFNLESQTDGFYKITVKHSGKVLDISGSDRSKIHQWDWHGGDNQRFDFEPVVLDERIETFKQDVETQIATLNNAISALEIEENKAFNISFNLAEKASPRFYLPREPFILLKRNKKDESDEKAFYPMFLEWEMAFYPVDDPSDNDFAGYDEQFLDDNFAAPSDEPDFKWKENATQFSKGIGIYEGITMLSDHSKDILLTKFENAVKGENPLNDGNKEIVNAAIDKLNDFDLIGQKLEGFNDALLQCKQTIQLSIKDPLTGSSFEKIIDLVAYSIGDNISTAPNANNDFNPIRAGGMDVSKVNLIDSFGRYIEVFNESEDVKVIASEPLMPSIDTHHLFLPPRFTQPVRIDVRWIPAEASNDDKTLGESNKMVESSPICGWVVPNNLEKSLLVYNQAGEQEGILAEVDGKISFEPSPYDTDGVELTDIQNIHLRKLVEYYIGHSVLFFYDSLQILNDSLEYIAPDAFAQYPELSIFVNRPIALVRAKITFERMEELATSNNWDLFAEILEGATGKKFTQGYEDVKIPIRLGDYQQLNDGIIGYWKDGSDLKSIDLEDKFYAPISKRYEEEQSEIITSFDEIDIEIQQSLNDEPQYVTLLFDPRGSLNVTTGVTPVKTIDIPNQLFKDTLRKMQATFLMSPVLTEKDKVQLPTMDSDLFGWNWLQYTTTETLKTITDDLLLTKAKFEQGMVDLDFADFIPQVDEIWNVLLENNWLKVEGDKTIVQRQLPALDKEQTIWADHENKIRNIVELYSEGIRSVEATPNYNHQEVIEGWLKLTPK